jgi:hypothetical protein
MTTSRSIQDVLTAIEDRNKGRESSNLVKLPSEIKKVPFLESKSELLSMRTKDFENCGFGFLKIDVKVKEKESFDTKAIPLDPFICRPGAPNIIPMHHYFESYNHYTFLLSDILYEKVDEGKPPVVGALHHIIVRNNIEAVIRTIFKGWNGKLIDEIHRPRGKERTSEKKLVSQYFPGAFNIKYIPPYCYASFVVLQNLEHFYEIIFTYEKTQASKEKMEKEARKIENHGYVRHLIFDKVRINGVLYSIDHLTEEEMRTLVGALAVDNGGRFSSCEMKRNRSPKKDPDYKGHCMPTVKTKYTVKSKISENGEVSSSVKVKKDIVVKSSKRRWVTNN